MVNKYSHTTVEILRLHATMDSCQAIAQVVGCSRGNVSRVLLREASKAAQQLRAKNLQRIIQTDGTLNHKWPVSDLMQALHFDGRIHSVLTQYLVMRGIDSCSLSDLLDILLPPYEHSTPCFNDIPIVRAKDGGKRRLAAMVEALGNIDFGDAFRIEFIKRRKMWF